MQGQKGEKGDEGDKASTSDTHMHTCACFAIAFYW